MFHSTTSCGVGTARGGFFKEKPSSSHSSESYLVVMNFIIQQEYNTEKQL